MVRELGDGSVLGINGGGGGCRGGCYAEAKERQNELGCWEAHGRMLGLDVALSGPS